MKLQIWPTHWAGGSDAVQFKGKNVPWLQWQNGNLVAVLKGSTAADCELGNRLVAAYNFCDGVPDAVLAPGGLVPLIERDANRTKEACEIGVRIAAQCAQTALLRQKLEDAEQALARSERRHEAVVAALRGVMARTHQPGGLAANDAESQVADAVLAAEGGAL